MPQKFFGAGATESDTTPSQQRHVQVKYFAASASRCHTKAFSISYREAMSVGVVAQQQPSSRQLFTLRQRRSREGRYRRKALPRKKA